MDIVDRLVKHDLWFTGRLLERAEDLPEGSLDQPVLADMPLLFGSHPITLREILGSMVANKQRWSETITGTTSDNPETGSLANLRDRLSTYGAEFQRLVKSVSDKGAWDDGFVDASCDPARSFTYGGMLAHVITFSAYRRDVAILAFRELGIEDLGIGDPVEWERQAA